MDEWLSYPATFGGLCGSDRKALNHSSFTYFMQLIPTTFPMRAAAMACLVLLGACSKKNDTPTPATTTAGLTWTVDNTDYSSTVTNATVQGTDLYLTGVSGTTSTANNTISIVVPAATGTYSIASAPANANYLLSYNINSSTPSAVVYVASNLRGNGSGTVTVTTYSATEVIGTFSFTGDNASGGTGTKVITNGKFNVKR